MPSPKVVDIKTRCTPVPADDTPVNVTLTVAEVEAVYYALFLTRSEPVRAIRGKLWAGLKEAGWVEGDAA